MIKSILAFALQVACVAVISGQSLYYTVKFPDDYTVYGCGADPGITYPYIVQYSCNFNVGVSYHDQVFYTNNTGGCYKILRTWKLLYWCDYDPNWPSPYIIPNPTNTDIGPTVNGNSYNHGYLQYTQIIKVVDNEKPYFPDCPTGPRTFCDFTTNDPTQYNNGYVDLCEGPVNLKIEVTDDCSGADIKLSYRLFLDLDGNGTMETFISSSSPNAWPIETTILGGVNLQGQIKFPPGHGFPYGTHKIEWIADDKCGNEAICKYEFIVTDCKPPTLVCYNGLSVNIMQTGMITIWDKDFIKDLFDNCTPKHKIRTGIRKAGTGTGFPAQSPSVTFDCSELGKQYVEVWAVDESGAIDYCLTYIDVQDNSGSCPPSNKFTGTITTDDLDPVAGATVNLSKFNNVMLSVVTDDKGKFEISPMTASCNYKLAPTYSAATTKGINTLDALLVAGQIDNVKLLNSPYKLLAADVDKSGNLTSADINNIVKMALGVQSSFPNNVPAWQFVPKSHVFPNPQNPWSASVPSSLTFCLSGPINFDPNFIAIKTGDVNGSFATDDLGSPNAEDRGLGVEGAVFQTNDQIFSSGKQIAVDIITPELAGLAAFQFTLDYNPDYLSYVGFESDLVPADFIADPGEHHLTASWHSSVMLDPNVQGKNIRLRAFRLIFNTVQKGLLSEVLSMSSAVTDAEAYTRNLQTIPASLEFLQAPVNKATPSFLSVRPNPITDRFTAAYYLPEAGFATFTLTDATGQVLQSIEANRERGYNEIEMDVANTKPGMLFLRLEGPGGTDVQKVMKF